MFFEERFVYYILHLTSTAHSRNGGITKISLNILYFYKLTRVSSVFFLQGPVYSQVPNTLVYQVSGEPNQVHGAVKTQDTVTAKA